MRFHSQWAQHSRTNITFKLNSGNVKDELKRAPESPEFLSGINALRPARNVSSRSWKLAVEKYETGVQRKENVVTVE